MDARELKLLVDNFPEWSGNTYKLATLIAEAQREKDAQRVEDAGYPDLASELRGV